MGRPPTGNAKTFVRVGLRPAVLESLEELAQHLGVSREIAAAMIIREKLIKLVTAKEKHPAP